MELADDGAAARAPGGSGEIPVVLSRAPVAVSVEGDDVEGSAAAIAQDTFQEFGGAAILPRRRGGRVAVEEQTAKHDLGGRIGLLHSGIDVLEHLGVVAAAVVGV